MDRIRAVEEAATNSFSSFMIGSITLQCNVCQAWNCLFDFSRPSGTGRRLVSIASLRLPGPESLRLVTNRMNAFRAEARCWDGEANDQKRHDGSLLLQAKEFMFGRSVLNCSPAPFTPFPCSCARSVHN